MHFIGIGDLAPSELGERHRLQLALGGRGVSGCRDHVGNPK